MNSLEISSSEPNMSHSDQVHAHNMRVYDAEMAEYEASCPRKAACNIGMALVCTGIVGVAALPFTPLADSMSGVMSGVYLGIGVALCTLGGCAIAHADLPDQPQHPDFREEPSA